MAPPTRERIVRAAERLFAERGIDAVSLREISREAQCRNVIAAQYYFSDRIGIVQAVLNKHAPDVEHRRDALLDEYEAREPDLRTLAGALARPLASKLNDADGGPQFLQIYANILNQPRPMLDLLEPSLRRWHKLVGELLEDDAIVFHRPTTALGFTAVELGRRARSEPLRDYRLFTSWLVDNVAALLAAPISAETKRLLQMKEKRR